MASTTYYSAKEMERLRRKASAQQANPDEYSGGCGCCWMAYAPFFDKDNLHETDFIVCGNTRASFDPIPGLPTGEPGRTCDSGLYRDHQDWHLERQRLWSLLDKLESGLLMPETATIIS
jgi:hypothetical protein